MREGARDRPLQRLNRVHSDLFSPLVSPRPLPTVFSFDHRLAFARLCLLLRGPQTKNTDKSINFKNYMKCIN